MNQGEETGGGCSDGHGCNAAGAGGAGAAAAAAEAAIQSHQRAATQTGTDTVLTIQMKRAGECRAAELLGGQSGADRDRSAADDQ
ncbi:MAG: hypothetical protein QM736_26140 [Vicinamibacterales bacterium]